MSASPGCGCSESFDWLSDDVFGWGIGIFFAGYLLLEIPGALLVEHWSATQVVCPHSDHLGFLLDGAWPSCESPRQFYLARFFLGLAEAGFFPGVIVYFYALVPAPIGRGPLSGLVFGVPVSLAIGSQMSAFLMRHALARPRRLAVGLYR